MAGEFFIDQNENRINVHEYGSGSRLLIAFHGFGESGAGFAIMEPIFGKDFTLYAPDLPFHGQTAWHSAQFTPADLAKLIHALLERSGKTRFSILGFSMGGRMALCAASDFISQTDHLILLAPDGLKKNFWFNFATHTWLGHVLFHYITFHPRFFDALLKAVSFTGLVNKSISAFVSRQMSRQKERILIYRIWTSIKDMRPDPPALINGSQNHHVPIQIYFGRYDRIVPPSHGKAYQKIPGISVRVMESGHQLLQVQIIQQLYKNMV